jgi:transposase
MNVPNKFITPLDKNVVKKLELLIKNSEKARVRQRAQAIMLSSKKFSIDEIAKISGVGRNSISSWISRWEKLGFEGLADNSRPGGPPKLNDSEKELLFDLVSKTPRDYSNIIGKLYETTGKLISESTIKRLLKNAKIN